MIQIPLHVLIDVISTLRANGQNTLADKLDELIDQQNP